MDKEAIPVFVVGGLVILVAVIFFLQQMNASPAQREEAVLNEGSQSNTTTLEDSTETQSMDNQNTPPPMMIDESKEYTATLKTSEGDITIKLNADATPITVNNFVSLAESDFYDDTIFHRVIDGFMIQGGDPNGDGTGGPGYRFDDEPFEGEYKRGIVAMANAGPNTNGSQFFIMHKDYALPPNYVIFGEVIEGMETVDAIATAETLPGGEGSTPADPVTVQDVVITTN